MRLLVLKKVYKYAVSGTEIAPAEEEEEEEEEAPEG